jgi:hypothetical protein
MAVTGESAAPRSTSSRRHRRRAEGLGQRCRQPVREPVDARLPDRQRHQPEPDQQRGHDRDAGVEGEAGGVQRDVVPTQPPERVGERRAQRGQQRHAAAQAVRRQKVRRYACGVVPRQRVK